VPRRNRVTPFGDIIATEARGLLFGNRGVFHDEHGQLIRAWQIRRWIACQLVFKGRRRELMRPGRFTELLFLDEATALAAGQPALRGVPKAGLSVLPPGVVCQQPSGSPAGGTHGAK